MKYFSTRSGCDAVSFEHAVIAGLAPDGGLYIPSESIQAPSDFLTAWKDLTFQQLAAEIFSLYIPESEVPRADLEDLIAKSYSTFKVPEVTPVRALNADKNQYLLELFHGPTYAFKDVALQFVGNLFEYFLTRRNVGKAADALDREKITVIGATSGDTGSAAIYGLRNKKDVSVFILYPEGRVSPIQEQQMTTVLDPNVHTITVPGTFDDCQDLVKQMFADKEFNSKYHVGAVNSINWARILAQITYYFASYFQFAKTKGSDVKVKYVVPTGNFGDILAGFYAEKLGLPIELTVATNANDILYRFFKSGAYTKENEVHATLSPAMDIIVSSNFERFLWHAARSTVAKSDTEAGSLVKQWMDELKATGSFRVPSEVHKLASSTFGAQHTNDKTTKTTIAKVYNEYCPNYVLDPHTAVGVNAAWLEQEADADKHKVYVTLSTAHPAKFSEAVNEALVGVKGYSFENDVLPDEFKVMMQAKTKKIKANSSEKAEIQQIVVSELAKEQQL
ncbi:Threonine synthase [Wickerhamiella sorbophila]|uniref:threonine synthase n=1 Tax=Wickerhamiella sorbophila TaxID=45607 RepID=A0A2T0FF76_9ASCO|nr:Threonine synthase [Wickerhamiella sorbophila]PRT53635.1 Threonine synthase [Wickerhamiella sorbophila]